MLEVQRVKLFFLVIRARAYMKLYPPQTSVQPSFKNGRLCRGERLGLQSFGACRFPKLESKTPAVLGLRLGVFPKPNIPTLKS